MLHDTVAERSRQSLFRALSLAGSQAGVVHRAQLRTAGLTRSALDAQLESGRWRSVGPLLAVTHNGPLTPEQQEWVAVLSAAGPVALAGRTAAAKDGLTGWSTPGIEIVVPRGARPSLPDDVPVIVHESRRFTENDIHPVRRPPRTRLPRSVVDGAVWSADPRSACGLLCAAVQQRLVTSMQLRAELIAAGNVRHRNLLRATLADIDGGAQALSEIDVVRIIHRHHLPVRVERQVVRVHQGRRRYLDVTLTAKSGRRIHLEIDGALHLLARSYWDDMLRGNELVIAGDRVLRFPTIALRLDECVVVDQIARALNLPSPLAA